MLPTPTDFSVFAFVTMLKLTVNRSILPTLMIAVLLGCRQDPTNVATLPVESLRVAAANASGTFGRSCIFAGSKRARYFSGAVP